MRTLLFLSFMSGATVSFVAPRAHALQPLETFLEAAHKQNPDVQAADATLRQREAEVGQARGKLLPSLGARGSITHNQFEAIATLPGAPGTPPTTLTIIPRNQLDAFFTLDVPLIDLSQYARYGAQKVQVELADAARAVTRRTLDERVIRAYSLLTGATALIRSAEKSVEVADKNRAQVADRVDAGVASELDLARAVASVERARQDVADGELTRVLAARSLETLSRVTPEPVTNFPDDDLHAEAPIVEWTARAGGDVLPERRLAEAEKRFAEAGRDAAKLAFIPVLSAQAQERLTNATGFTGRVGNYTISATLAFRFDFGQLATVDVAKAASENVAARAESTRRNTEDAIVEAWHRITANVAKAKAARAQFTAAERAAVIAQDRYALGAATQLDVTQAQRDAFIADVGRIQSNLDLAQARALLRLVSGQPIIAASPAQPDAKSPGESR